MSISWYTTPTIKHPDSASCVPLLARGGENAEGWDGAGMIITVKLLRSVIVHCGRNKDVRKADYLSSGSTER